MSDFEARYAALCRGYAERLPARLAALRTQIELARSAGTDTDTDAGAEGGGAAGALREARDAAHKLHGTAGSYGFDEVTLAFGVVEAELDQLRAGAGSWEALEGALEGCAEAIERTALSADRTS